ncbi:BTAD domain-containing putative transcriptional regulator [Actinoplanes oblitus]|uniref:BTAD domain-containing putative transcriptional regulator n=1 Tax=Actinoplanes oblitus TaxID=3040509 RepID=A0ABY8W951_9ACTN|nr:BTAD domain-containing putative transcriptional regulator [Actinoplanes oblitus]WIM94404.1 BTAD domain-containing putative transcriptional regulator [Actinoplanes oblitus]
MSVTIAARPISGISVRTLGSFEVTFNGFSVGPWKAGKARHLLQLLLLHRNRVVLRDVLVDALWPAGSAGSSSLKVAVHMLRRVLAGAHEQHLSTVSGSSLRLVTCESGYMLEAREVWTDHDEFEELVAQAHTRERSGDLAAADDLYGRASRLYRGDFLPDVHEDWAATHREWLRSRQLYALEFLSRRRLAQCDQVSVIDLCRRMLAIDPLHEPSYRMLISVHSRLGQPAQARRWYDLCAERLRDSAEAFPDEDTQRLYRVLVNDFPGNLTDARKVVAP